MVFRRPLRLSGHSVTKADKEGGGQKTRKRTCFLKGSLKFNFSKAIFKLFTVKFLEAPKVRKERFSKLIFFKSPLTMFNDHGNTPKHFWFFLCCLFVDNSQEKLSFKSLKMPDFQIVISWIPVTIIKKLTIKCYLSNALIIELIF